MSMPTRTLVVLSTVGSLSLLAACSVGGTTDEGDSTKQVTIATHDSWAMSDEVLADFTEQTGYTVKVEPNGDAGQLTNKLVLTKGAPIADAVYGIDNTFASRAVEAGVLVEHTPEDSPASAADYALPDPVAAAQLVPIDFGDVCVNVDDVWFAEHDVVPPRTLQDLTEPAYRNLMVAPGATTSSPGLAFLLATISQFGEEEWEDYWQDLLDNGLKITSGWSDAYEVDFTAGGGGGDRPIVVSYASSPPFTIPEGKAKPTTSALLDTCFRQVEYAGVLDGAENPEGAKALIDFMQQREFQQALPDNMYVFPVNDEAPLPESWAKYAKVAPEPLEVDPEQIQSSRDDWLRAWGDLVSQ